MSAAFHVGTYLSMGADFDSRNRYLRKPADGVYEGQIVAGETWSTVINDGNNDSSYHVYLRFKMGDYTLDFDVGSSRAVTGVSTGVTSA
jgi:hypothetical protein